MKGNRRNAFAELWMVLRGDFSEHAVAASAFHGNCHRGIGFLRNLAGRTEDTAVCDRLDSADDSAGHGDKSIGKPRGSYDSYLYRR